MKKKMLLMMLALTVSVALIVGATMSWFTDDVSSNTEFTAGTVIINEEISPTYSRTLDNVNPGDCYVLTWEIKNQGSKYIQLQALIKLLWDEVELQDEADPTQNILIVPQYGSKWVMYQPEGGSSKDIYLYYLGEPEDGIGPTETITLPLVVYFDGELTGDEYQDKQFKLECTFLAVQASNGAPSAVFGEAWDNVNKDDYEFTYDGWVLCNKNLNDIPCYEGEPEPEPTPALELEDFKYDIETGEEKYGHFSWKKTVVSIEFTPVDQYGDTYPFTGSQDFKITYSGLNHTPYTIEEIITVEFTNGIAEAPHNPYIKDFPLSGGLYGYGYYPDITVDVEKVVPPADE